MKVKHILMGLAGVGVVGAIGVGGYRWMTSRPMALAQGEGNKGIGAGINAGTQAASQQAALALTLRNQAVSAMATVTRNAAPQVVNVTRAQLAKVEQPRPVTREEAREKANQQKAALEEAARQADLRALTQAGVIRKPKLG